MRISFSWSCMFLASNSPEGFSLIWSVTRPSGEAPKHCWVWYKNSKKTHKILTKLRCYCYTALNGESTMKVMLRKFQASSSSSASNFSCSKQQALLLAANASAQFWSNILETFSLDFFCGVFTSKYGMQICMHQPQPCKMKPNEVCPVIFEKDTINIATYSWHLSLKSLVRNIDF